LEREALSANEKHKETITTFLHALINDDAVTMRDLVSDDVRWWLPESSAVAYGMARPLDGWAQVPWFGGDGWKGFQPDSSKVTIHHLVAEDDLVSAHYNRSALRVNGNTYDSEYNMLFRFDGDLIVEVWEVVDTAQSNASK
jgi:ketosteroid isomerase-like protein